MGPIVKVPSSYALFCLQETEDVIEYEEQEQEQEEDIVEEGVENDEEYDNEGNGRLLPETRVLRGDNDIVVVGLLSTVSSCQWCVAARIGPLCLPQRRHGPRYN